MSSYNNPFDSSDHTDHLGSNRVVATHTGQVEQRNMFCPYGANRADCWSDSAMVQRWKYSGKELDSFLGLHCYDYGFRWYDPIICRWTTPYPMREKYYDISAYAFCGNNPMNNIDRFGNDWVSSKFGNELFVYYDSKISSQEDIVNFYYNGERRKHYDINYVGKDGIIYEGTENGKEVRYHLLAVGKNAVDIPAFHDFVINRQYYTGKYTFRFVQYD